MKYLFVFIMLLCTVYARAQQEPERFKPAAALVYNALNNEEYQPLYLAFSKDMANAMPADKVGEFFTEVREQFGTLREMKYEETHGKHALYDMLLINGRLQLQLTVDDSGHVAGFRLEPHAPYKDYPIITRNKTPLSLPFKGQWYTVWGGDTPEQNYHVDSRAQKGAFDFVVIDDKGNTYKGDGKQNADYYAFGKEIIAPCDAVVTDVVDGVRDNVPGEMNTMFVPGNMVILKTSNDEYLFFAHFKQYSIQVKPGDKVKKGQMLGYCGNSGNTSEPHLHFHIQNTYDIGNATGAKTYFEKINVKNDGGTFIKNDYSPVQGDAISN